MRLEVSIDLDKLSPNRVRTDTVSILRSIANRIELGGLPSIAKDLDGLASYRLSSAPQSDDNPDARVVGGGVVSPFDA